MAPGVFSVGAEILDGDLSTVGPRRDVIGHAAGVGNIWEWTGADYTIRRHKTESNEWRGTRAETPEGDPSRRVREPSIFARTAGAATTPCPGSVRCAGGGRSSGSVRRSGKGGFASQGSTASDQWQRGFSVVSSKTPFAAAWGLHTAAHASMIAVA